MGIVYRAVQTRLNRPVALKMVLGGDHVDGSDRVRFLAEAEVVASIRHPHVVQVYECGDTGSRPFYAMEFLEGGSLAA
jgi:serine/threonine-protein kinase